MRRVELNSIPWICLFLSCSLNAQLKTLTTLGKQLYITQVTSIPCLSSAVDTLTLPFPDSSHYTDCVIVFLALFSVIIPRHSYFIQLAKCVELPRNKPRIHPLPSKQPKRNCFNYILINLKVLF